MTTRPDPSELIRRLVLHAAAQDRASGLIDLETEGDAAWIGDLGIGELDLARLELNRLVRAAKAVKVLVDQAIIADIEEHGPIRLGDDLLRVAPKRTVRVLDQRRLIGWLHEMGGLQAVSAAIRVDGAAVRLTVLRVLADEQGISRDAIEDTFLTVDHDEQRVEILPISRAPQWAQRLGEGERR